MGKATAIIGASSNPERYSYMATTRLKSKGHPVFPVGIKEGKIDQETILTDKPQLNDIHTVTMYIGPQNQPEWMDYILGLKPQRIIFNPGTENPEFYKKAGDQGIECIEACTLVMLGIGNY
ncbi:MAG: CoA-binding protein [Bacteroidia bacterium]|nr:CoA-binding protein [Bacteroidia bacterium]